MLLRVRVRVRGLRRSRRQAGHTPRSPPAGRARPLKMPGMRAADRAGPRATRRNGTRLSGRRSAPGHGHTPIIQGVEMPSPIRARALPPAGAIPRPAQTTRAPAPHRLIQGRAPRQALRVLTPAIRRQAGPHLASGQRRRQRPHPRTVPPSHRAMPRVRGESGRPSVQPPRSRHRSRNCKRRAPRLRG